ncbi:hypothetical protein AO286_12290 [Pseudomonas syringae]|uniref:hypothetical protein n=1 Tax=Pseudomonas syringae group TaxID=136849 RepID=UPI000C06E83C|nr:MULTISPECIES: hypothetical protein [Pseudomonas syringae group]PHN72072.1 hypothetical protein AO286_12290 [Pseudomonas syringae]RMR20814.1 hypothetical protein ALP89_200193 [Pseudomonas syringae pv. persicae]
MDSSLPALQLKESHALALDTMDIPVSSRYTLAVAPSARTMPGDKVHVTWQGFFPDGSKDEPFVGEHEVMTRDQVLSWDLDATFVLFVDGGTAQMSYRVEYSDAQGGSVDSDIQTIDINPPSAARLTALSIENHTGGPIDPEDYPRGLELNVKIYADIQVGDCVLCYINGGVGQPQVIDYLLVDQSIIDNGTLQFTVEQPWLENNKNETAVFEYQYARYGKAESSYALSIEIREAFHPLAPIIDGAFPETSEAAVRSQKKAPSQGYIDALSLRAGASVRIPSGVELMDGDTVEVQWQGFGTSGEYTASVSDPEDERLFLIPASAVPANMGKLVNVLYRINRPGKILITSEVFILRITSLPTHSYPTVQCSCTDIGRLLLNCVPEFGAVVTLRKWIFMAPGQRLTIEASSWTNEQLLSDFPITQTHIDQGQVTATLSKSFLTQLGVGAQLMLKVSVSFDEGNSLAEFPALSLVLAIKQPDDHDLESYVCIQTPSDASLHYVDYATAGMSRNQLIEWMRVKPRTMGWGAILAFNRKDTNTVLLQEYINRFSTGHYLDPVTAYIPSNDVTGQYISDYVMDYPRLSFENANVEADQADAKLTMKVVGGTQVAFTNVAGGKEATWIGIIDPLSGPQLTLDLELVDVPASVNKAGQVVLDLSNSSHFSLSHSEFLHEQLLGGSFFQELFSKLPPEERVMVISEIIRNPDDVIRPSRIKLRTQAAPGSKLRHADNYGEGAVLVMVAMEGENNGGNPDTSFPYLLPNDEDYSAMLLMSNKLVLKATIGEAMVALRFIEKNDWSFMPVSTELFTTIYPRNSHFSQNGDYFSWSGYNCSLIVSYDNVVGGTPTGSRVVGSVKDDRVALGFHFSAEKALDTAYSAPSWPAEKHAYYDVDFNISIACGYTLDPVTRYIKPNARMITDSSLAFSVHQPPPLNDPVAQQVFQFRRDSFTQYVLPGFTHTLNVILDRLPDINVFALQSILFKSSDSIVFDNVALPGDMAIFGHLGPSVTRFSINPLEPVVGLGESLQFTTEPAVAGVKWTADEITTDRKGQKASVTADGSVDNSAAGTIGLTGLYKAPNDILGKPFMRVKVTATLGNYTSSALVSVVISDITVNPLIQTCMPGATRTLSAGTLGSDRVKWSLRTPANGGKLANAEGIENVYTAPPAQPGIQYFVEEIVVENIRSARTRSTYVLVLNTAMSLSVTRDESYTSSTKARLVAKFGAQEQPAAQFEVLLGSGSINQNIYTTSVSKPYGFALIRATLEPLPSFVLEGYILLPLPLFDYPQASTLSTPERKPAYRAHLNKHVEHKEDLS